jgi:hypothetical protein
MQPNTKPANMPSPPNEGIGVTCTYLSSGTSYSFLILATLMMIGIAKYETAKEIDKLRITSNIRFN